MCVDIIQMVGYVVPVKKVMLSKTSGDKERAKVFNCLSMKSLSDGRQCIFYVFMQKSSCECGDTDGNGREFSRNTFDTLIIDEDDEKMHDIGAKKSKLAKDLEDVGLLQYATWGFVTDAYADSH